MRSNLRIVIDPRQQHPFGAKHRLLYWAKHANVRLVLADESRLARVVLHIFGNHVAEHKERKAA